MASATIKTDLQDGNRRKFLTTATTLAGVAGVTALAVPFVTSWLPSEKTRASAAPVQFELSRLEPGQQVTIAWRSKPIFILRRTPVILQALNQPPHRVKLVDPDSQVLSQQPNYAMNPSRSIRDEFFIVIGICTHLGCIPTFRPEFAAADISPDWVGGYYCPCHGSRFDLAGRVYKNVPAPTNLVVPPYRYLSDTLIKIGKDSPA